MRNLASMILLATVSTALAADPFPGTTVGEIGASLPASFEPSGAVWHDG
jgi:hypothetical protein